jgi:RNA polymerase sigma-70 factor, ECF subfamily
MPTEPNQSPDARDPDLDLIEAYRRGTGSAFDVLVHRHEARVLRLCSRILSDADAALDAAQETFVKAWRALAQFHGDARFSTWLTRIAINQCRNELRRRRTVKHTQPLSLDATPPGSESPTRDVVPASGPDPYEVARGREVQQALALALSEIDDEAREVLLLRDAEDLSYDEIAQILEVPIGTIRSRLHRARGDVRRRLGSVLSDVPAEDAPLPRVP